MVFTFQKYDYNLKNESRKGPFKGLNSGEFQTGVDENPSISTMELSKEFNLSYMPGYCEMKRLSKVSKT